MKVFSKRRGALGATAGLLLTSVPIMLSVGVATAASTPTTNACFSNATATFSDLVWTLDGTATPDPITLGTGDVTLGSSTVAVDIPATLLVAGYNLGLLSVGPNNIPTTVFVARQATNSTVTNGAIQTQVGSSVVQVDSFTAVVTTTITDTDGTPGTGDETATPLNVLESLPDMVVTPSGGNIVFRQADIGTLPLLAAGVAAAGTVQPNGSLFATASVAGGLVRANFDCFPGTTDLLDDTTYTPATPGSIQTVVVNAPPTAPACVGENLSVGVTQTATINLNDNCTDVNEDQGGGSPFTFVVDDSALVGTLVPLAPGVYEYTAPANDPGVPDVFSFTAEDTTGLVSSSSNVSITVLANQCDATGAACSLTEIVVQPVVGTTMVLDKVPGVVQMSTVILDGNEQVSTGALQSLTVTNARGTAAGWDLTAYVTDLGAAGSPTLDLTPAGFPGVVIPACSNAGSLSGILGGGNVPDRLCIPGDNLGWSPAAVIAHNPIPGDVAEVVAGSAHAANAAAWLALLVAAGNSNDPAVGVDGLGGLQEANLLCQAPINHSGGTFTCDATLWLGVPASAGAGIYTGGLVLTLV